MYRSTSSARYPYVNPPIDRALSRALSHLVDRRAARVAAPEDDAEPALEAQPGFDEGGADPDAEPTEAAEPSDLLFDTAALLRVVREPVEWALRLAHQLANGDPVDVAAVDRVRAAFHARLAGRRMAMRTTDLLIVLGLLVTALDPSVVLEAVSETLGDGLAAVLHAEAPILAHFTRVPGSPPRCARSARRGRASRSL